MASPKILVVESDLSVAQEIEEQLEVLGYPVCASVQRGVQAIKTIPEVRPDLVLVDIELAGELKGDEVAEEIYHRFNIPVVYLMDSDEADLLEGVKMSRVFGHVFKPFNLNQLRLSIEHCLYHHEKRLEYTELEAQLNQTIKELHDRTQRLETTEVELKQTVQELQEQQQLMETIFNSVSDGIVVTNEEGAFLFVNPSAERIVGMGATDTTPDEWSEIYGTFYLDKVTPFPSEELPLVHAMQGKMTDGVDLFIRNQENPDGVFINVSGRPLRGEQNSVRGGVIVFRDVTTIKNTEAALEQTVRELQYQTQLMDTIFNSISDGVVVADEQGQFIKSNPAAEQMTGQHLEELEIDRAAEQYGVFHPTQESLFPLEDLPLVRAVNGESTDNVEMRLKNPALSEDVYLSVNGRPLLDEEGTLKGGVAVARDVTELKRTESELKQQSPN